MTMNTVVTCPIAITNRMHNKEAIMIHQPLQMHNNQQTSTNKDCLVDGWLIVASWLIHKQEYGGGNFFFSNTGQMRKLRCFNKVLRGDFQYTRLVMIFVLWSNRIHWLTTTQSLCVQGANVIEKVPVSSTSLCDVPVNDFRFPRCWLALGRAQSSRHSGWELGCWRKYEILHWEVVREYRCCWSSSLATKVDRQPIWTNHYQLPSVTNHSQPQAIPNHSPSSTIRNQQWSSESVPGIPWPTKEASATQYLRDWVSAAEAGVNVWDLERKQAHVANSQT